MNICQLVWRCQATAEQERAQTPSYNFRLTVVMVSNRVSSSTLLRVQQKSTEVSESAIFHHLEHLSVFQSLLSACSFFLDMNTLTEVRSFRDLNSCLIFKEFYLVEKKREKEPNSISFECCSVQVCVDKGEKEGGGENKRRECGGDEGGSAAVLTTARLIHPEHAELLCFGYWLQVKFGD